MPRGKALAVFFLLVAGLATGAWIYSKWHQPPLMVKQQRASSPLDVLSTEERVLYDLVERSVVSPSETWLNPIGQPLPGEKVDASKRLMMEFEARAAAANIPAKGLRERLAGVAAKLRAQPVRAADVDAVAALAACDFEALNKPEAGSASAWCVWLAIAKARFAEWQLPETTLAFERALALWPEDASTEWKRHVVIVLGRAFVMQRRFTEGEKAMLENGPHSGGGPWSVEEEGWWANELANQYLGQGKLVDAEKEMRRALEFAEKVYGLVHVNIATCAANLAVVSAMRGNFGEALRFIDRAEAIGEKVLQPADPRNAEWAMHRAGILNGLNRSAEAVEYIERAILHAQKHYGVEHVLTVQLRKVQADAVRRAGGIGRAERMEKDAIADLEELLGEKDPARVVILREQSSRLASRGDRAGAERILRHALDILPKDGYSAERGAVLADLGELILAQRRTAEAATLIEKAVTAMEAGGETTNEYLRLLRVFARVRQAEGKPALARLLLDRVLSISEKNNGPESRAVVDALAAVATFQREEGRLADSEAALRRIHAIIVKITGVNHPDSLRAKFALAECIVAQGRTKEAIQQMQEVITTAEGVLPANDQGFIYFWTKLARAHQELNQHAEAIPFARRALALAVEINGENHPDTATTAATLARSLYAGGAQEEAEKLLQAAVDIARKTVGTTHSDLPICLMELGRIRAAKGAFEDAEKLYRASLYLYETQLSPDHPGLFMPLALLGDVLGLRGRHAEAAALLRRALILHSRTLIAGAAIPAEIDSCREIYARSLRAQGLSEQEIEARIRETAPQVK